MRKVLNGKVQLLGKGYYQWLSLLIRVTKQK